MRATVSSTVPRPEAKWPLERLTERSRYSRSSLHTTGNARSEGEDRKSTGVSARSQVGEIANINAHFVTVIQRLVGSLDDVIGKRFQNVGIVGQDCRAVKALSCSSQSQLTGIVEVRAGAGWCSFPAPDPSLAACPGWRYRP